MTPEEDHPIYNEDDLDDEDDDMSEHLNGAMAGDSESSSGTDDGDANSTAAVTVAIPASIVTPPSSAVTVALPVPKRHRIDDFSFSPVIPVEKKPIDDSRRLFQRLWTDEDEIELLQGFLEYTASRGTTSSGHHYDTSGFYDQIKSKLQLEFNKNQLVEKLRRLKKKYRTVLSKMSSGKEFVFKSPHDQATFEISKKIWGNFTGINRGPVEFDDDDQNPNPNPNSITTMAPNNSFLIGHINLNNAASSGVDHKVSSSSTNNFVNFDLMVSKLNNSAAMAANLSSRKRPKVVKVDEKFVRNVNFEGVNNANVNSINNNNNNNNNNVNSSIQGLVEETVRSCMSPLLKELINNAVNGPVFGGGNFSGLNFGSNGEVMNEKWRKQQILELEVYWKRLELVQEQIKSTLEELRSMGS